MSQATTTPRRRRADAQRNYERILAVGRAAVAARGDSVVLEDIARDAGVGIGTLYRHFPTRQALFEAVFLDEVEELRERAEGATEDPSPLDALVSWLRLQMDFGAHGRSMGAAVLNAKHTEGTAINLACTDMRNAGTALLRRAQAAGEVRADVDLTDVLRLIHGVVLANEQAPDAERVARMFALVIAGITT
jgi:AcrR family transcriptional regulator